MNEFAAYAPGLALTYAAFLLAVASPGPNVLALIQTSMTAGRPAGLAQACGIALGALLWSSMTVAGLAALLAAHAEILRAIRLVGGLYLLYLAWKAFGDAASNAPIAAPPPDAAASLARYVGRGLAVQMTNPKAALSWVAMASFAIDAAAPLWVGFAIVVGTVALSLAAHALYALVFSTAPMLAAYRRARRWLQAGLGAFFTMAGLRLLLARN